MTRYSILVANLVLLIAVVGFVAQSSESTQLASQITAGVTTSNVAVDPLDQLSSADIAVNVARMTRLAEATSAANHADTVNALLSITPSDQTIVAKPQVVATAYKSNKDITRYVTKPGDTVSKLAEKFHVTSDSIRGSNGLTSDLLTAGKVLYIPPFNGIVYVVRSGDTAASLADKYNSNKEQIIAFNDAELTGLKVGTRIVIPNGLIPAAAPTPYFGFGYSAVYGYNGYDYGWCTWYASQRRAQLGKPVPSNLGDAYSWYYLAQQAGLPTGLSPRAGAVAVNLNGNHVSVVEQVNSDGSFWVSEMNSRGQKSISDSTPWGGWAVRDYKLYTSAGSLGFIY